MSRLIALADIYEPDELDDFDDEEHEETLCPWLYEDWRDQVFEVTILSPEQFSDLLTKDDITPVLDVFHDHAEDWQIELVASKAKEFDADRIVVRHGMTLLDGYHHVAAAAQRGEQVLCIDLAYPLPAPTPAGPAP